MTQRNLFLGRQRHMLLPSNFYKGAASARGPLTSSPPGRWNHSLCRFGRSRVNASVSFLFTAISIDRSTYCAYSDGFGMNPIDTLRQEGLASFATVGGRLLVGACSPRARRLPHGINSNCIATPHSPEHRRSSTVFTSHLFRLFTTYRYHEHACTVTTAA